MPHSYPYFKGDYRPFTDYRPNEEINLMIMTQNNINNSYDYKEFIYNNGKRLMAMSNDFYKRKINNENSYWIPDPNNNEKKWENYKMKIYQRK